MIAQPLRNLLIFTAGLFLGATAHAAGEPTADPVAAAIGSSERPAEDRSQDAWRQPAAVLAFFGVKPGMARHRHLFRRRLQHRAAVAHRRSQGRGRSPTTIAAYAGFSAKEIAARYAGNRLSNVRQLTAEVDALTLEPRSLDAAMFVMCYHDLYWRPDDGSWPQTDPKLMLSQAARGAQGRAAWWSCRITSPIPAETPARSSTKLHRIDPAVVRRDFEARGVQARR